MDWFRTAEDARGLGRLYREASLQEGAGFRRRALDLLGADVPFCAAAWCIGRSDSDQLTAVTVRGLPAAALQPLLALGIAQWLMPDAADASSDLVGSYELTQADAAPEATRLAEAGFAQAFVARCPQPGTLFTTVLCLLRSARQAPFSAAERERLERLLPHLAQAETLALEHRLALDHRLAQAGRRNRGVCCLADRSGAIRAVAPGFRELLAARLPQWHGLRLPPDLSVEACAQNSARNVALAEYGLQARLGREEDDLYVVHLRPTHPFDRLTERERDVVKAIVEGESYKIAARRLGVSASTIANHASNIYRKLGALNREQVVGLATSFLGHGDDGDGA